MISLLTVGKTDSNELKQLIGEYERRLKHYIKFEHKMIPAIKNSKNLSEYQQREKEGELLLKKLNAIDVLILLDEKGKQYNSVAFSQFIQNKMNTATRQLVFVVGGPYGFSDNLYRRAQGQLSLSSMTFSHQMVRLFFVEQLYRAFTILRNEPYHHK